MSDQFVSRGGIKLQAAIDHWKLNLDHLIILDVGSSTGGFVDCLLQNGAAKVYSVDTAYGELAWKLRNDPRVVVMERTNILHLQHLPGETSGHLEGGQEQKVDMVTIDASWTKLELILPIIKEFLKPDGQIVALLKPHYQADKKLLDKGVLPKEEAEKVKDRTIEAIAATQRLNDLAIVDTIDSPIEGGAGNHEYLLLLKPSH